jgi:trehalose 6-phosphate phosphatase
MTDDTRRLDAVLFDMDGVVTDTAVAHFAAWKALFDVVLRDRDPNARPFDEADYRAHVDGKPRYDGVADFLASRGIGLPRGAVSDPPEAETVCGLGNRKNRVFNDWLAANRVEPFPGSLALLDALDAAGIPAAVFSSSRNAEAVLASAGIRDRFRAKVDGEDGAALDLPGKPDPAYLIEAASRLGADFARSAVIEDALSGVEAAARGGFAQVIGIDRDGDGTALADAGAHIVVADLAELMLEGGRLAPRTFATIPSAWDASDTLAARLSGRRPAVFLDYDGTLSPIVEIPADAVLSDGMRAALKRLAAACPVAIVSGRDLANVQSFVADDSLYFAGSHGFDLAGPNGWREVVPIGRTFLPALDAAAAELEGALARIPGARLERKRFSLAVHYRQVAPDREADVAAALADIMPRHPRLKHSGGKKVYDVKPRADWHKGRAVLALLAELGLDGPDVLPVYLGDDTTDEDAFRALSGRGLGVVVRDGSARRTAARYGLDDTDDVERFLHWLADIAADTATEATR